MKCPKCGEQLIESEKEHFVSMTYENMYKPITYMKYTNLPCKGINMASNVNALAIINKYLGEIYKNNNTQYQNTTYNKGFEPHAQRTTTQYNKPENNGNYMDDYPKINLPDFKKVLSNGKNGKSIGVIVFACIIAFNMIFAFIGANEVDADTGLWEDATVVYE